MTERLRSADRLRWGLVALAWAVLLLPTRPSVAAPGVLLEMENAIADVVDRVKPAVVSISAQRAAAVPEMPVPRRMPTPMPGTASGSGMIFRVTNDAIYILTNAHVVRGAKDNKVEVKLVAANGKRPGTVLGTDRLTDVAVVRMDRKPGENPPTVTLGKARDLRVGTFVLAIGSPFSFEASVTLGIVSSLERELDEPGEGRPGPGATRIDPTHYSGLIQTDASINPGNSGGPLVNMKGEVVGINFAIFSPGIAGSNIGIGFAIPSEKALAVVEDLISKGRAVRGYLGVSIADAQMLAETDGVTLDEIKTMFGTDQGAFVKEVRDGTPAAKAGIRSGDVIVALEGTAVKNVRELQDKIRELKPGVQLRMEVLRDKKKVPLAVTLGELPAALTGDEPASRGPGERVMLGQDPLGLTVEKAGEADLAKIGKPHGLKVTAVEAESRAADKDLPVGAFLIEGRRGDDAERVKFTSVEAWRTFISKAAQDKAFVTLWVMLPSEEKDKWTEQYLTFALKNPRAPQPR